MRERPLRIGVIGAGRMGRIHAEGLAGYEEVESVVTIGRERGMESVTNEAIMVVVPR